MTLDPRIGVKPFQDPIPAIWVDQGETAPKLGFLRWGLRRENPQGEPQVLVHTGSESIALERELWPSITPCIIPATGVFARSTNQTEYQHSYIRPKDGLPMGLAGVWGRWKDPDNRAFRSCVLVTVQPNELIARLGGSRMPAILQPTMFRRWLNVDLSAPTPPEMLAAYSAEALEEATSEPS